MEKLITLQIQSPACFLLLALLCALIVRLIIALVEAWDRGKDWFIPVLLGYGKKENGTTESADRLLGLGIGYLELISYPALIFVGLPEYIGAWLVFKTANRWNYKQQNRGLFNRYLFANALVIFFSYLLARYVLAT